MFKSPDAIDLSQKNIGSADVNLLTAWLATPAAAELHSVVLDANAITSASFGTQGTGDDSRQKISELDVDISGIAALSSALSSSQLVSVSMQNCCLDALAVGVVTLIFVGLGMTGQISHLYGILMLFTLLAYMGFTVWHDNKTRHTSPLP